MAHISGRLSHSNRLHQYLTKSLTIRTAALLIILANNPSQRVKSEHGRISLYAKTLSCPLALIDQRFIVLNCHLQRRTVSAYCLCIKDPHPRYAAAVGAGSALSRSPRLRHQPGSWVAVLQSGQSRYTMRPLLQK
jgi:hypothetical protein